MYAQDSIDPVPGEVLAAAFAQAEHHIAGDSSQAQGMEDIAAGSNSGTPKALAGALAASRVMSGVAGVVVRAMQC